jgi:uncharacterized protein YukE
MTQPYLGMDPEQVRQMAAALTAGATEVRELTASIGAQIEAASWTGQDREAFVSEWQTMHAPGLTLAADALDSAATKANSNADAQEQTSAPV